MPTVGTSGETLARLQRREAAAAFSAKIKTKQSAWVSLSPLSQNLIKKETTMRWLYKLPDHLLIRSESPHLSKIKHFQSDASERERERERERGAWFFLFVCFFLFFKNDGRREQQISTTVLDMWPVCGRSVTATPAGIPHSGGSLLQLPHRRREEEHGHRGPRCSGRAAAADGKERWSLGACAYWRVTRAYVETEN